MHSIDGETSVRDLLDGLGIPCGCVDLVLVNGESVDLAHRVRDGDRISFYPVFEAFDITLLERLRKAPLRDIRFVAGPDLRRLVEYLRMFGLDARYVPERADAEILCASREEGQIVLTRDPALLGRGVSHGYCVRGAKPRDQLLEVLARLDLYRAIVPLGRCLGCNSVLPAEGKSRQCPTCGKNWGSIRLRRIQWFVRHVIQTTAPADSLQGPDL